MSAPQGRHHRPEPPSKLHRLAERVSSFFRHLSERKLRIHKPADELEEFWGEVLDDFRGISLSLVRHKHNKFA